MKITDLVCAIWGDRVPSSTSRWVIINAFTARAPLNHAVITALAQMPSFMWLDILASAAMHELA